jgi:methyl-accepting chemotaxis protein
MIALSKVELGSGLADNAGATMNEIVRRVQSVSHIVADT